MNIRLMTINDYDEVYALWTMESGVGLRSLDDSKEGIAKFLCRNQSSCFVAEEKHSIVGCILCGNDGRRGYIYHAMVKKEYRCNGIGKALVDSVVKALEEDGICKVGLFVKASNNLGNGFWQSQCFTKRDDLFYWDKSLNEENI